MPDAPDYRLIFRQTPEVLLVLARDFTMLDATDARLVATLSTRENTIGRNLFGVFPDNPLDPAPTGTRNLRASLEYVLATGRPDAMAVQKYDIPAFPEPGAPFEERYWSPLNTPVLDEQGRVLYIVHRVEDVTDYVRSRLGAGLSASAQLPAPADPQERDLILRAREIQTANRLLRESHETMRALRQEAESHRGRLEALLVSVTDAFLLLGRDFCIHYLNPPEARFLGAPPERLLGTLLWDSLPAEARPAVEPFLRQAMDERRPVVFEYHDQATDLWFEKRACPALEGVAVLTVDVSKRKIAQKLDAAKYAITRDLAASPGLAEAGETVLRHLCAAVDAQVGCFWQKTPDGEFLELTYAHTEPVPGEADRFAEFLDLTRSRRHSPGGSLPGRVWVARKVTWIPDLAADPEFTRGPAATAAGLVGGIGIPVSIDADLVGVIELFLPRRPAPCEAAFRALGAAGSEISQFIRRRRAEAAQARLSAIVHSSHDAIVGISSDRLVTSWNHGAKNLYGHAPSEMIGREITRIIPDDRLAEFEELFARVLRNERIEPLDTVRLRKDGARIDVSLSWSPIHADDGVIVGISSIARDITAQKRAEFVERRNRELQEENRRALEANRLKSDFLASMSHELRTPLHGVIGFSEFLVDEKVGPLNPTQKEFLNDVLNSGHHLLRLINNILDLSKIEAGRMELFPESLRLADLVQEVCAILRPLAEKHQVSIHFDPDTARFDVFLDPLRLRQILYNLLSNAVQYNRPDGRASVEILRLSDPAALELSVSDDGPGIRPEDRARIFEEFRQLGTSRSQSTGLGLAVTRRLVDRMRGEITLASEPDRGSRFTVRIPLPPPPAPPAAPPP